MNVIHCILLLGNQNQHCIPNCNYLGSMFTPSGKGHGSVFCVTREKNSWSCHDLDLVRAIFIQGEVDSFLAFCYR